MPCSNCIHWNPRPKKKFGNCREIEAKKMGRNELGNFIFAADFQCCLYERIDVSRKFEADFETAYWIIKSYGWDDHFDSGYHSVIIDIWLEDYWRGLSAGYDSVISRLRSVEDKHPGTIYKLKAESYDDEYTAKAVEYYIAEGKERASKYNLDGNYKDTYDGPRR